MMDDSSPIFDVATVEVMRGAVRQRISAYVAESLNVRTYRDMVTQDLIVDLEAALLSEKLPPKTVELEATVTVPRFASWFQQLRATYRQRRWFGWLFGRRRPIRFVDEQHTLRSTVELRAMWTYPNASMVLPGRDFGHAVLNVPPPNMTTRAFPW